ncbi:MAG: class I SAM-dependent methyltransferase [Syntrophaceae bacterium]|nr:class I SAM-dependent methyltransferase [Syntrophaceae bacterium]
MVGSVVNRIRALLGHPPGEAMVNASCREFEVNKWVLSEFILRELVPVVGIHPFPLDELLLMTGAVCRCRPRHIYEWGTNIGTSARIFFETARRFRLQTEIHSIDLPDDTDHVEHPRKRRGILVRGRENVRLYQGDGLEVSLRLSRDLDPGTPLLFFLDGDHGYDSVSRELNEIMEKRPGASILIHDTFNQSSESGYNTGPWRAVKDALRAFPGRYARLSTQAGLPGMTLLVPDAAGSAGKE